MPVTLVGAAQYTTPVSPGNGSADASGTRVGAAVGDLLLLFINLSQGRTITPPSGWATLLNNDDPSDGVTSGVFWRRWNGTDTNPFTFGVAFGGEQPEFWLHAVRGVDAINPIGDFRWRLDAPSTLVSIASVPANVSQSGSLVFTGFWERSSSFPATQPTPAGLTVAIPPQGYAPTGGTWYERRSPGATPVYTHSLSSTHENPWTATVVLSGGGSYVPPVML